MDKKPKILLVEDEMFVRDLYERVLSESGFEMLSAVDGQQGLELAQTKPDLVLLDIMLPGINGIDLLKKLKADTNTKRIPIILITNLGQESIIKEGLALGAEDCWIKMHFSPYDLADRVQKFFEHSTDKRFERK